MQRKTAAQHKHTQHLLPYILNKRRYSLKKILNRYMGLPFSQYQPDMSAKDIHDAGLGDAFMEMQQMLLPGCNAEALVMEPVAIEVRGIAVAFDEEVSFSAFRSKTLQSPVYGLSLLPQLQHYGDYCQQYPMQTWGTSLPAVEQALRERSLQDFMQDLMPAVQHMPLIRLSVFDKFTLGDGCQNLGYILEADLEHFYLPVADQLSIEFDRIDTLFSSSC